MALPVTQTPPRKVPVLERLARNMLATLGTIKKANGYSFDAIPTRPKPGPQIKIEDGTTVLTVGNGNKVNGPQQFTSWDQKFHISGAVVQSETDPRTTIDERVIRAIADIGFALTFDANLAGDRPNATRLDLDTGTPLAEDTLVDDHEVEVIEINGNQAAFTVSVRVIYRTRYNDPYTSIYDA